MGDKILLPAADLTERVLEDPAYQCAKSESGIALPMALYPAGEGCR
jgi:hypothetical protein